MYLYLLQQSCTLDSDPLWLSALSIKNPCMFSADKLRIVYYL